MSFALAGKKIEAQKIEGEQYGGADKRAALEICVIKDSIEQLGGEVRWVPHEENCVDSLTKLKGNTSRLLTLMKTGRYKLTGETSELENRKQYREETGMRNPRPKVSTHVQNTTKASAYKKVTYNTKPQVEHYFSVLHAVVCYILYCVTYWYCADGLGLVHEYL